MSDLRAKIRFIASVPEVIGAYILRKGDEVWLQWSGAKGLVLENKAEFLEFTPDMLEYEDPNCPPGFPCPKCGKLFTRSEWPSPMMRHNQRAHGKQPEKRPQSEAILRRHLDQCKDPNKRKELKARIRREKKRKYHAEYDRKRQARLKADKE